MTSISQMDESLMEGAVPLERRSGKDNPHNCCCETAGKVGAEVGT